MEKTGAVPWAAAAAMETSRGAGGDWRNLVLVRSPPPTPPPLSPRDLSRLRLPPPPLTSPLPRASAPSMTCYRLARQRC